MEKARADPAKQVKEQVSDVAIEVLHVVAENPQEKHVASDVQDSGVQEHAGEQGQQGGLKGSLAGKRGGEPGWDGGIGDHEGVEGVRRQSVLVEENEDVGGDEGVVDDGISAAGIQIFKRDEHEREWELQSTGNEGNCKLQKGARVRGGR